jgi:Protein of unknown function (DUF1574)
MSRRRHHRRTVLWVAAAFVGLQMGLAVAVDGWLPEVRDPEYAAKERRLRERMAELPGRPLVLVLGSSRTAHGLYPALITGKPTDDKPLVFNFSFPGCGPFLQRVCFERLRAAGIKPDMIFIEVMPAFFNRQRSDLLDQSMLDGARLTWHELGLLARYADEPLTPLRRYAVGRCLPAYRYQAELREQVGLDEYQAWAHAPAAGEAIDSYGWHYGQGQCPPDKRQALTELAHRQYDAFYQEFRLAEGPAQALRDLLARARKEGIRAALVLMPEATAFRSAYTPAARAGLMDFLNGVIADFEVPLVNAEDWVSDDGFYDGHHMLPLGAAQFTIRFGQVLAEMEKMSRPGTKKAEE